MSMKAIIFGGSGFLGVNVAQELIKRGIKVIIFDKKKPKKKIKNIKVTIGSIENYKKIEKSIKGCDYVFNFAALADIGDSINHPIKTVTTNILGTVNLLEASRKYKIKRYIFASSIYVFSQQGSFYRASKQSSELYIEEYKKRFGLNYTILRFGSVYGSGSDPRNGISRIINDYLRTKKVIYRGTNKAERKFIHIKDAAKASANMIQNKFKNKIITIVGKKKYRISNILNLVTKLLNVKSKPKYHNKIAMGHYDKSPDGYAPKPSKKYLIKPTINIENGIRNLIKDIQNQR